MSETPELSHLQEEYQEKHRRRCEWLTTLAHNAGLPQTAEIIKTDVTGDGKIIKIIVRDRGIISTFKIKDGEIIDDSFRTDNDANEHISHLQTNVFAEHKKAVINLPRQDWQ